MIKGSKGIINACKLMYTLVTLSSYPDILLPGSQLLINLCCLRIIRPSHIVSFPICGKLDERIIFRI